MRSQIYKQVLPPHQTLLIEFVQSYYLLFSLSARVNFSKINSLKDKHPQVFKLKKMQAFQSDFYILLLLRNTFTLVKGAAHIAWLWGHVSSGFLARPGRNAPKHDPTACSEIKSRVVELIWRVFPHCCSQDSGLQCAWESLLGTTIRQLQVWHIWAGVAKSYSRMSFLGHTRSTVQTYQK